MRRVIEERYITRRKLHVGGLELDISLVQLDTVQVVVQSAACLSNQPHLDSSMQKPYATTISTGRGHPRLGASQPGVCHVELEIKSHVSAHQLLRTTAQLVSMSLRKTQLLKRLHAFTAQP